MKTRLNLVFSALIIILISLVWVVRDRGSDPDVASASTTDAAQATVTRVESTDLAVVTPASAAAPIAAPTDATAIAPALAAPLSTSPAPSPTANSPAPATADPRTPATADPRTMVHIDADGTANYTARQGDTLSELAAALLGSDSKAHRVAIIAANPSLQNNPDRVLSGANYTSGMLPSASPAAGELSASNATADEPGTKPPGVAQSGVAQSSVDQSSAAQTTEHQTAENQTAENQTAENQTAENQTAENQTAENQKSADSAAQPTRTFTYRAQPGDNVAILAASLLGADNKANRDSVISNNASLVRDPDRLLAGKTYNIVTTTGLSAASGAMAAVPTTQPDADEAARLGSGRVLQYTAQPGDTVSKLAKVLLGEDTPANEAAIVANNWSLKQNPNHIEAGQTYWLQAPTK
jgi:hypothetical protein